MVVFPMACGFRDLGATAHDVPPGIAASCSVSRQRTAQHVIPGDEDVFMCQSGGVGSASLKKICLLNWDSPAKDACYINET